MQPLSGISGDQILQIALFVGVLLVIWVILRTVMHIAMRVFTLGCGAILVLALILLFLRYLNG